MAKSGKIVHLLGWDKKFVPSFIQFVGEHFTLDEHHFIIHGDIKESTFPSGQSVTLMPHLLREMLPLMAEMRAARKIIIHGLFSSHLQYLLLLQPWLLKKCYWVIWGGDLYVYKSQNKDWRWHKNEIIRRFLIKRLGHIVGENDFDIDLAVRWYGSGAKRHKCFVYPSNFYMGGLEQSVCKKRTNILLGNSADPSNNHRDALDKISLYRESDITVYAPLSYGDKNYAEAIRVYGENILGKKFVPIFDFMPLNDYLNFLSTIDMAIFNHDRQQAFGNVITLLGMGKKVYIKPTVTTAQYLSEMDIVVFDPSDFNLESEFEGRERNMEIVSSYFSPQNLKRRLSDIFSD